jgi:hypothetical protein
MANATTEIMWLQSLLRELHVPCQKGTLLWCDNKGAKYLSSNLVFHGRMKHIEVDYHLIYDQVMQRQLGIRFISTHDQIADGFTKPLPQQRLQEFRHSLNLGTL